MKKGNIETGIVHVIQHKAEEEISAREVTINSGTFTITLASNDRKETIDFLTKKALKILKQLKEEAR